MIFLSNQRRKLQEDLPPPQFPRLVGYPDLSIRKTLKVLGVLTVMIFFQSKHFTACKVKDEKEQTIFLFCDGVQYSEDYPSI